VGLVADLESKRWQINDRSAFKGRLVGAKANAGPIGGLAGIGERVALFGQRGEKFVDQMRV